MLDDLLWFRHRGVRALFGWTRIPDPTTFGRWLRRAGAPLVPILDALLCMLAYYVEWHMRRDLAELLFDDHDPEAAAAARDSVVAPAQRSPAAKAKASTKRTEDGFPVHSLQTLLEDLKTATKNRVAVGEKGIMFAQLAELIPIQERIFELLNVPYRA